MIALDLLSPSSHPRDRARSLRASLQCPPDRLSFNGLVLFGICLLVAASGFRSLRIDFHGLMVHPYLPIVGVISPLLIASRLFLIPARIWLSLGAFGAIYFASTFAGGVAIGEGLKIGAALVTIITVALLVRSRNDFLAGVLGLSLAMGFLAVYGLDADEFNPEAGARALDVANRNAYSLFALPVILLGSHVLLQNRSDPLLVKLSILASIVASVVMIAVSLNRSGWIGCAVIALLLFRDRRIRGALFLTLVVGAAYFGVHQLEGDAAIQRRARETVSGTSSDELRWTLIVKSFEVGLDNPLTGVSPQRLPQELAIRMGYSENAGMATHNVFAHLVGGTGFVCLAALFYAGLVLATWRPSPARREDSDTGFRQARSLLRMMLILWLVRGMFTHEILYTPGFTIGLGLCIGLCLAATPQLTWEVAHVQETPRMHALGDVVKPKRNSH